MELVRRERDAAVGDDLLPVARREVELAARLHRTEPTGVGLERVARAGDRSLEPREAGERFAFRPGEHVTEELGEPGADLAIDIAPPLERAIERAQLACRVARNVLETTDHVGEALVRGSRIEHHQVDEWIADGVADARFPLLLRHALDLDGEEVDLVREREPRELEVEPRVEVAGRGLQFLDLPKE